MDALGRTIICMKDINYLQNIRFAEEAEYQYYLRIGEYETAFNHQVMVAKLDREISLAGQF
jgi:hypothetical protein